MSIWKIGIGVVAIFALAAATVGFVGAQTDDDGNGRLGNFVGRLAENLGITQDELESAIDQTQLEQVEAALAEGLITEEQAAQRREAIESGEARFGKIGQRGHKMQRVGGHIGGDVAEFIGIEPEELREAIEGGQSLVQVAEANGVSEAELTAHLLGELETKLGEAVESGRITQAEADEKLAGAADRIAECINREGPPEHKTRFGGASRFPGSLPLDEGADVTEAVSPTF